MPALKREGQYVLEGNSMGLDNHLWLKIRRAGENIASPFVSPEVTAYLNRLH